jgi:hypothetical protein
MGLGKARRPTIAFLVAGILNLGLSIGLARPLGLAGVAWGTGIPDIIFALAVIKLACSEMGVRATEYISYVLWRPAIAGAALIIAFQAAFLRFGGRGIVSLAAWAVLSFSLFGVAALLFVFRNDRFTNLMDLLRRRTVGAVAAAR